MHLERLSNTRSTTENRGVCKIFFSKTAISIDGVETGPNKVIRVNCAYQSNLPINFFDLIDCNLQANH